MNDIVQTVAKALFEHDQVNDETRLQDWPEDWDRMREAYTSLACAALLGLSTHINELVVGAAAERLRAASTEPKE